MDGVPAEKAENAGVGHQESGCKCSHEAEAHYSRGGVLQCQTCEAEFARETPELMTRGYERRRHERVSIPQPIRTSIAGVPGHLIDASVGGVALMHQQSALPRGAECRLVFYSQYGPITIDCEVARTAPNLDMGASRDTGAWRTGLRIVSIDAESDARLRHLVLALTDH
jgi:hypothetical protein